MSLTSQEAVKRGSVSTAFYKSLFSIYLICILLAIPSVYFLTKDELYSQANKELKIIVDVVRSARAIVRERTRPHFLPKGVFFPTVVSSTVMAKELATHFKKLQPNYLIRMVSDNPLNQENYPDGLELKVLEMLRHGNTDNGIKMTGVIDNRSYLISATATKVKDGCLVCHGSPKTAPQEITNKYGKTSGYGWKSGSIIGANLVGVPVADLNTAVLNRFALVTGAITVLFAFVLLVLTRVVQKQIIEPIQDITDTAKEISLGRRNTPVKSKRNDEIGALTRSFELMRRSINIATKKINKLTEAKDD
jgi:HAMP domain-containing protein